MFFHMVYKSGQIFLPFCHNPRVWQTDRRTDRQNSRLNTASALHAARWKWENHWPQRRESYRQLHIATMHRHFRILPLHTFPVDYI